MMEGLLRMEDGDQILPFVRMFYEHPVRGLGRILPIRQDQLISRRNLHVLQRNRTAKATHTARLELLGCDQEGSGDSRSSLSRNC